MVHNEKDTLLGTETDKECETDEREENGKLIKHKHQINKTINKIQQSYSIELEKQIAVEYEAIKKNSNQCTNNKT